MATVADDDVTLTWDAPSGNLALLGYNVYRSDIPITEIIIIPKNIPNKLPVIILYIFIVSLF